jgi:flagellar biosynthesis/type III secretory pathway M-ring protein FliF/YscJ
LARIQQGASRGAYGKIALPIVVGFMLAGLLAYAFVSRRPRPVAEANAADLVAAERSVLVEEMASLDDRFERGELEEEAYQEKRSALKARLRQLAPDAEPARESGPHG